MYSVVLSACTCPAYSAVDPLKEWTEVKLLGKGNSGDVLLCKSVNTGEQLVVRKVSCHPSMQEVCSHYSITCPTVFIPKPKWFTKLAFKSPLSVPQIVSKGFLFFVCPSCHGIDCTIANHFCNKVTA